MATKLVSMKIDQAARDKMTEPSSVATDAPLYPYGLEVRLDNDALEKLGIDVADLTVGDTLMLTAKVEVTSVSSNASKGGENQSASLQITEMGLDTAPKGANPAGTLYDGAKAKAKK